MYGRSYLIWPPVIEYVDYIMEGPNVNALSYMTSAPAAYHLHGPLTPSRQADKISHELFLAASGYFALYMFIISRTRANS